MARITYVKKAAQRYRTVPVIDPATGEPKVTAVLNKRTGEPKVTKRGRPVTMRVTVNDKTQPLPPATCDYCHKPIEVGTPYKHIKPKSGPYGGRKLQRHAACPTWQVWDYSHSLSAQLARISYDFGKALEDVESQDDVETALQDAAEAVREIAEAKRESAQNIEDGFGHATYQSDELNETADSLDGWADEIESTDVPELPDTVDCEECNGGGKVTCEDCAGSGQIEDPEASDDEATIDCPECVGDGDVECDDCGGNGEVEIGDSETGLDEWRDEVLSATSIVDDCPV